MSKVTHGVRQPPFLVSTSGACSQEDFAGCRHKPPSWRHSASTVDRRLLSDEATSETTCQRCSMLNNSRTPLSPSAPSSFSFIPVGLPPEPNINRTAANSAPVSASERIVSATSSSATMQLGSATRPVKSGSATGRLITVPRSSAASGDLNPPRLRAPESSNGPRDEMDPVLRRFSPNDSKRFCQYAAAAERQSSSAAFVSTSASVKNACGGRSQSDGLFEQLPLLKGFPRSVGRRRSPLWVLRRRMLRLSDIPRRQVAPLEQAPRVRQRR